MNIEQIPTYSKDKKTEVAGPLTKRIEDAKNESSRILWAMQIEQAKKDLATIESEIKNDPENKNLANERGEQLKKIEHLAENLSDTRKQKITDIEDDIQKLSEERERMGKMIKMGSVFKDIEKVDRVTAELNSLEDKKRQIREDISRLQDPLNTEKSMAQEISKIQEPSNLEEKKAA